VINKNRVQIAQCVIDNPDLSFLEVKDILTGMAEADAGQVSEYKVGGARLGSGKNSIVKLRARFNFSIIGKRNENTASTFQALEPIRVQPRLKSSDLCPLIFQVLKKSFFSEQGGEEFVELDAGDGGGVIADGVGKDELASVEQ
jgi:hypothetical protein